MKPGDRVRFKDGPNIEGTLEYIAETLGDVRFDKITPRGWTHRVLLDSLELVPPPTFCYELLKAGDFVECTGLGGAPSIERVSYPESWSTATILKVWRHNPETDGYDRIFPEHES